MAVSSGAVPLSSASLKSARLRVESVRSSCLAVGETVNLMTPPLALVGASIGIERGCHQNDKTLADGSSCRTNEVCMLSSKIRSPAISSIPTASSSPAFIPPSRRRDCHFTGTP